jgi:hypothetical protein
MFDVGAAKPARELAHQRDLTLGAGGEVRVSAF